MRIFFNNLKFSWRYAKDQKKYLIIFIIFNFFGLIASILFPIIGAKEIVALTSSDYKQIMLLSIYLVFLNLLCDVFHYFSRRCSVKVYRHTLSNLEIDLGRNVLKLENKCLDDKGSGVFIQRMTNDTSRIAEVFNVMLGMISELVRYIGIIIAIFVVNKAIFCFVLISLTLQYIVEKSRTERRNKDDKIARKAGERVSGFVSELVRGAHDIKMLNSEEDFLNELGIRIDDANYKKMKMQKTSWSYKLLLNSLMDISSFGLIGVLVFMMINGLLLPTIALVIYNYVSNLTYSVYLVGDLLDNIKDFNLSSERIKAIIDGDEFEKEKFGTRHLNKINGDFSFNNVTFGYKNKKILKNLNFNIKANQTVAFVGKSGAGKTTIFNLLCKMYNVNSGHITIDGIDLNELDKDTIRGNITIISQDPYIFNMSIRDNLKLVKRNLTKKEMKEACKIACLEDFIKGLPDGYDTIIGEGGVNLSGGQKQRLAIARALVQKTEIILFDEATSALDNETQENIQRAIENMKNEYTILIIAHRLSTIINADRILYLENGKIISEGTHKELLHNCEAYHKLYETEIIDKEENTK